jgi:hypothetical protein
MGGGWRKNVECGRGNAELGESPFLEATEGQARKSEHRRQHPEWGARSGGRGPLISLIETDF